jgi:hypothetical protein
MSNQRRHESCVVLVRMIETATHTAPVNVFTLIEHIDLSISTRSHSKRSLVYESFLRSPTHVALTE